MSSLSGADLLGLAFMLLWGTYMLWLVNKGLCSEDSLATLITVWPRAQPREFRLWFALSTLVAVGLYFLVRIETNTDILARRHLLSSGIFISYREEHGVFRYSFTVQDHQYQGQDSSDQQGVESIEAGAPFTVYYDPVNPNINSVSEPKRRVGIAQTGSAFFGGLASGLLAVVIRKLGALLRASSTARPAASP